MRLFLQPGNLSYHPVRHADHACKIPHLDMGIPMPCQCICLTIIIICSYRILTFYSPLPLRPPLQYIQFACQYAVLVELSSFHLGISAGGIPPYDPPYPSAVH